SVKKITSRIGIGCLKERALKNVECGGEPTKEIACRHEIRQQINLRRLFVHELVELLSASHSRGILCRLSLLKREGRVRVPLLRVRCKSPHLNPLPFTKGRGGFRASSLSGFPHRFGQSRDDCRSTEDVIAYFHKNFSVER